MAKRINMLEGSIADKMFYFAWPLAVTGVLQQLFNGADVAVLGQFVGKNAMAAVGSSAPVIGLLIHLLLGIALGVNVVIARHLGAKQYERVGPCVQTAFFLSLAASLVIMLLGLAGVGPLLRLLEVPAEVLPPAETYLSVFLFGVPAIALYNSEAAILRSKGDAKTPMIALAVASAVNIALNLAFVLLFDWGVAGVAWATVIANGAAAAILLVKLCREDEPLRFHPGRVQVIPGEMREMVRIGLPAGI
ncbi:MAG: MATE family efflux transporter, partial [Duodenibacillus sp.]|nr:MATE family efflux transporter [Duodenibacillus sp.]